MRIQLEHLGKSRSKIYPLAFRTFFHLFILASVSLFALVLSYFINVNYFDCDGYCGKKGPQHIIPKCTDRMNAFDIFLGIIEIGIGNSGRLILLDLRNRCGIQIIEYITSIILNVPRMRKSVFWVVHFI